MILAYFFPLSDEVLYSEVVCLGNSNGAISEQRRGKEGNSQLHTF